MGTLSSKAGRFSLFSTMEFAWYRRHPNFLTFLSLLLSYLAHTVPISISLGISHHLYSFGGELAWPSFSSLLVLSRHWILLIVLFKKQLRDRLFFEQLIVELENEPAMLFFLDLLWLMFGFFILRLFPLLQINALRFIRCRGFEFWAWGNSGGALMSPGTQGSLLKSFCLFRGSTGVVLVGRALRVLPDFRVL